MSVQGSGLPSGGVSGFAWQGPPPYGDIISGSVASGPLASGPEMVAGIRGTMASFPGLYHPPGADDNQRRAKVNAQLDVAFPIAGCGSAIRQGDTVFMTPTYHFRGFETNSSQQIASVSDMNYMLRVGRFTRAYGDPEAVKQMWKLAGVAEADLSGPSSGHRDTDKRHGLLTITAHGHTTGKVLCDTSLGQRLSYVLEEIALNDLPKSLRETDPDDDFLRAVRVPCAEKKEEDIRDIERRLDALRAKNSEEKEAMEALNNIRSLAHKHGKSTGPVEWNDLADVMRPSTIHEATAEMGAIGSSYRKIVSTRGTGAGASDAYGPQSITALKLSKLAELGKRAREAREVMAADDQRFDPNGKRRREAAYGRRSRVVVADPELRREIEEDIAKNILGGADATETLLQLRPASTTNGYTPDGAGVWHVYRLGYARPSTVTSRQSQIARQFNLTGLGSFDRVEQQVALSPTGLGQYVSSCGEQVEINVRCLHNDPY